MTIREALLIFLIFTVNGSMSGQELRVDSVERIFTDRHGTRETRESYSYVDNRNFRIRRIGYGYSQELLSDVLWIFRDSLLTETRTSYPSGEEDIMKNSYDMYRRLIEQILTSGRDTISWSKFSYMETDTSDLRIEHRLKDWEGKEYYFVYYSENSQSGNYNLSDFSRINSDLDTLDRQRHWIWVSDDTTEERTLHTFIDQVALWEHFRRWPVYTEVSGDTVYTEYRYQHYDVDGSMSDDFITAAIIWDDGMGSTGEMHLDTNGYYQAEYEIYDEVADSTILDFYEGRDEMIGDYRNWRETLRDTGIKHVGTRVEHFGSLDELLRVHLYTVDTDYFFDTDVYYYYDWINSVQTVVTPPAPTIIRQLSTDRKYFDMTGRLVISEPYGLKWLIEVDGRYSRKVLYIGQ